MSFWCCPEQPYTSEGFVDGSISLYGRDESGWHFWHEIPTSEPRPSTTLSWALSSERLAVAEGAPGTVTLYRFAPAPEPTYHAPDPPCERDGKLLAAGTPCQTEMEPVPICFLAGYNGCFPKRPHEFWRRFGTRSCSGSSAACDGPWVDGGEIETICDQDFDIWCSCNYRCGIDVCEVYSGC